MRRITLLTSFILAFATSWGQLNITTFRVKSNLPAEINAWTKDPASVLLVAIKIPLQKIGQVKLVIQIRSKGAIICGYQPQEVKAMDSSFALKALSASDLLSLMPKCANLPDGSYQLCARFYNADNKPISNESCKEFTVGSGGTKEEPKVPGTGKNNYTRPQLKYPNNGAELKVGAINNLQLSWEPVSPTPKQPLTYRWFIYEMKGGRSVPDIVKNGSLVKQGTVKNSFFTTVNLPADSPGKTYAWTVQAVNDEGGSYGDNDGFADPFVFSVQSGGKVPGPKDPGPGTQRTGCRFEPTGSIISCNGKDKNGNLVYVLRVQLDNSKPTPEDLFFNHPNNYSVSHSDNTSVTNTNEIVKAFGATNNWLTGITLSPQTPFPSIISANSNNPIDINVVIPPGTALPKYFTFYTSFKKDVGTGYNVCDEGVVIADWPPCPCDICETLQWNESLPKSELGLDKNTAKLTQSFSIPGLKIKQVKADIVSFDWVANEDCKKCLKETYGYFIDGSATGEKIPNKESSFPSLNGSPLLFSSELQWNHCGPGTPQPLNGTFIMNVALPPQTSLNCCMDQFRVCVRYTIVTEDCKTCTKLLCYVLTRNSGEQK